MKIKFPNKYLASFLFILTFFLGTAFYGFNLLPRFVVSKINQARIVLLSQTISKNEVVIPDFKYNQLNFTPLRNQREVSFEKEEIEKIMGFTFFLNQKDIPLRFGSAVPEVPVEYKIFNQKGQELNDYWEKALEPVKPGRYFLILEFPEQLPESYSLKFRLASSKGDTTGPLSLNLVTGEISEISEPIYHKNGEGYRPLFRNSAVIHVYEESRVIVSENYVYFLGKNQQVKAYLLTPDSIDLLPPIPPWANPEEYYSKLNKYEIGIIVLPYGSNGLLIQPKLGEWPKNSEVALCVGTEYGCSKYAIQ